MVDGMGGGGVGENRQGAVGGGRWAARDPLDLAAPVEEGDQGGSLMLPSDDSGSVSCVNQS